MQQIFPGVWKLTLGVPEPITPVSQRHKAPAEAAFKNLSQPPNCPISETTITGKRTRRGYSVRLPLAAEEQVYGLGLQLLSFNQRQRKKTLRVNSDPRVDLGDSHAPVPFYVTTAGYGVLIDTARYATFYFSTSVPQPDLTDTSTTDASHPAVPAGSTPEEEYVRVTPDRGSPVLVDIPSAAGVDVYIFAGPGMRQAVQRYNLFSGGGCLPPRWGLGVWYRVFSTFDQTQILDMADSLRQDGLPCDVLGLEPGWQSHFYSCSFVWSSAIPDPAALVRQLSESHFHTNLWTHVFTHPTSPIYDALRPYCGDFEVWGGLVPDLITPQARQILGDHFAREHADLGVSGYKLDECDNSDYNVTHWSFPEMSEFPSGADGEQMHSLIGLQFQHMVDDIYRLRDLRTYGDVRSSHALAAPYPFVLYSDLYDHKDFIRGLVNSGFSGLLWTPEVRDAASDEDLIRRLQTVVLSPQAQINAWYIKNPPWKQWRRIENNDGQFLADWPALQAVCRKILELRMALIPYLYAAYYRYYLEGLPPFRALVMDYPDDPNTFAIDDQFLLGDRLLAAPVSAGETQRSIYLPQGDWFDFWSGKSYIGGQAFDLDVPLDIIPLFVKSGALLPLAHPTPHTADPASLTLDVRVFGDGILPFTLYEDDGLTLAHEQGAYNRVTLTWDPGAQTGSLQRSGAFSGPQYTIAAWKPSV